MGRQPDKAVDLWNFSNVDWADKLKKGKSLLPDLPLNKKEAQRALNLFNRLRLPDVMGTPTLGESSGPWLGDIVRATFGSLDNEGIRRVPEIFSMVPKKNGKTTGGGAIMITAMLMNERPNAEFALVGPTQIVALKAYDQACGMIACDEEGYLQKRFKPRDHLKTIEDLKTGASVSVRTFDLSVATGGVWAGILLDELHEIAKMSYASRVIGQLRGGLITTPESFLIIITTQSNEPPTGAFESELAYARGVRDGNITGDPGDIRMLPLLYEFPEEVQQAEEALWRDPKIWHMVLPNLGKSIKLPRLISEYKAAVEKGKAEEKLWASQHLNIEIGLGMHHNRWRGVDYWSGAHDEQLKDLDELLFRSEVVTIGGDGGGLDDMLGLGVIGRCKVTKHWLTWAHAWVQSDVLENRKDISEALLGFAKEGDLTLLEPHEVNRDLKEFADVCQKIFKMALLPEKNGIGLDPYSITALVDELASRKIFTEALGGTVRGVKQGSALSPASWGMERKLKDGTLRHGKSKFMNWIVSNAKSEQRGGAVLITKQISGKAKIDPLVALFNSFMLMSLNPTAKKRPVDLNKWLSEPAMRVG